MSYPYNNILGIPERCLLNKRITKAFFLKNFSLSPNQKKLLNNNIDSMLWLASIKPSNSNIQAFSDESYSYEEIQVMVCTLKNEQFESFATQCIELFQKFIPYPILLIVDDDANLLINACDKRINQSDKSKRTIVKQISTVAISKLVTSEVNSTFYNALKFENIDKTNLQTVYNNYINALVQFKAASITGSFKQRTQKRSEQDMVHLLEIEALEKEIIGLKSQLSKESQLSRKVNLNVAIQKKRQEIKDIKSKLS